MTVASRVAVAVVSQVSYRVITYYIVTILSCRRLQLEWAKSYRVVLCQPISITKCSQCLVSQLST